MQKRGFVILLSLLLVTLVFSSVEAQSRSVYWNRWDVLINNVDTKTNSFDVTESYDIDFTGSFHFGSVVILFTNLDNISDVSVSENGKPLQESCSQAAGTFCTENTNDGLSITYYFFRTLTNASAQFDISYHVDGALRVYSGGDQLWWIAIPSNHYGYAIENSTIKVEMPQGYAPREGVDSVETYGAPGTVNVQGTSITATANRQIVNDETFEIRVQYPHNPAVKASDWQKVFDQQRQNQEDSKSQIDLKGFVLLLRMTCGNPFEVTALLLTLLSIMIFR